MTSQLLSEESRKTIGDVIVSFSFLEASIYQLLASLISIDLDEIKLISASARPERVIKLVKQIASRRFPNDKKEIEEIFQEVNNLSRKRDAIAHGLWWRIGKGGSRNNFRVPQRGVDEHEKQMLINIAGMDGFRETTESIKRVRKSIHVTHLRLTEFFHGKNVEIVQPLLYRRR